MPPPIPAIPLTPPPPSLTADQMRELSSGRERLRRLKRVLVVARFDGWTVGAFGALTMLLSLGSFTGLLLGSVTVAASILELKLSKKLERLDRQAPKMLALNQGLILVAITVYAIGSMFSGYGTISDVLSSPELTGADPDVRRMLKGYDIDGIASTFKYAFYGGVIFISFCAQGGLALYYLATQKTMSEYVQQTPTWVMEWLDESGDARGK